MDATEMKIYCLEVSAENWMWKQDDYTDDYTEVKEPGSPVLITTRKPEYFFNKTKYSHIKPNLKLISYQKDSLFIIKLLNELK